MHIYNEEYLMQKKPVVGIIMGSDSDLGVMEKAFEVFNSFNVSYEVKILSAHRTPKQHQEYSTSAERRGLKVIIAAAGGAAHLPGVTAAHTALPIIGVPIKSKSLEGMDSLLSIVQMPPGVPVATVSIDGAKNAALLALQIISLSDKEVKQKYKRYRLKTEKQSMAKNSRLKY
jgi:5-(carboxyamino)imidazole ribonucleotide mutase